MTEDDQQGLHVSHIYIYIYIYIGETNKIIYKVT